MYAKPNEDGTPYLQEQTPVRDLGVPKPYKKTLCPLQNEPATPRWGSPRHQTFKTCLERMYGCRRSCKIYEMQTKLPFLRMKLIWKKLDRKTSSSFLTILKAPRPWPGLMNIANISKVQRIKRKELTLSPMQMELNTCRSKLPSGTQRFKNHIKKCSVLFKMNLSHHSGVDLATKQSKPVQIECTAAGEAAKSIKCRPNHLS